ANTRSQNTENLRAQFQQGSLDLITALYHDPLLVAEDVITIDKSKNLTRYLELRFSCSLLFQSTASRSISHPEVLWSIFWMFIQKNRQKFVNVICQCCPTPIIDSDLIQRIARDSQTTIGKADSTWINLHKEFLLLSIKDCISLIYIDIGTVLTWLYVIHGRKIIYFPYTINLNAVRLLARLGSEQFKGYDSGWIRVELRPGDLFIMPLSCPHTVFTPDNSLVVGSHFYTSAYLPSTLEGLRFLEKRQKISNKLLKNNYYKMLAQILNLYNKATCHLFLDSPTKTKLLTACTEFITALKSFNQRAYKSFSQEPE
ncbi:hypothetical protein BDV27DRAFT_128334, partial [Aspergillus caelatus]